MKILILGGTRFIGAHLTNVLLKQGHGVVLLNRGEKKPFFDFDLESIHCDKADIPSKADAIRGHRFDLAIDMMATTINNSRPVITLLDGLVERFCLISSMDVYRVFDIVRGRDPHDVDQSPLNEESPLRQRLFNHMDFYRGEDLYDLYDKIPIEYQTRQMKRSSWTICRLPAVYGPGDYVVPRLKHLTKRLIDQRRTWIMESAVSKFRFTHGYVENVVEAIALAAIRDGGKNQVFNIGEAQTPTCKERYEAAAKAIGHEIKIIEEDQTRLTWMPEIETNFEQHWIGDSSKIRDLLGYQESIDEAESYRRTIEWEKDNLGDHIDDSDFNYKAEDEYLNKQS